VRISQGNNLRLPGIGLGAVDRSREITDGMFSVAARCPPTRSATPTWPRAACSPIGDLRRVCRADRGSGGSRGERPAWVVLSDEDIPKRVAEAMEPRLVPMKRQPMRWALSEPW
jgi:hypothetical protein